MSTIVGAILRPGGGTPAFQLCTFRVNSTSQEPSLRFATLADHTTKRSGSWRLETSASLSPQELRSITPSNQLCTWLLPSKLVLVCINNSNKKYRIYGLQKKPSVMPARSYDLEIYIHPINAMRNPGVASLAIGDVGGRNYLPYALNKNHSGLNWFSEADLRGLLRRVELPRASVSFVSDARIQERAQTLLSNRATVQTLQNHMQAFQTILGQPSGLVQQPLPEQYASLSPYVAKIIVRDARISNSSCPITFDEFKEIAKFSVPTCGHVCAELTQPLSQCPVCRAPTTWCNIEVPIET